MANETGIRPDSTKSALLAELIDLTKREGGLMSAHVPLGLIDAKDVPVNAQNLDLIEVQLDDESVAKGTDGQIQPVMLGLVDGSPNLHIIDGFHRFTTFQRRGHETIFATVVEVTQEELLDKRIQNTRNHSGLQFARATQWVREVWDLNPFSTRITATQAFTLGRIKSSTGAKLGLTPEEVKEIMEWIDAKAGLWGVAPVTIYTYLHTDERVASDLTQNSRPDRSQAPGPNSLPQSTLNRIGKQIPGREGLQREVAAVITQHRLGGSGITGILRDIKGMTDEQAINYLQSVDYAAYKENLSEKPTYKYGEDDILRLDRVRDSSRVRPLDEMVTLTLLHVDLAIEEGGFDPARLGVAGEELGRLASALAAGAEKIKSIASGEGVSVPAEQMEDSRSIEDFTALLTSFMIDPSKELTITTRREARAAERALTRGRGTKKALAQLEELINAFHVSHM